MGMDAILNVPPQVQYSSSLLHLGKMYFCYVRTGMPPHPHPKIASDFDIGDDKKRFISIVIFQAVTGTYKKNDTRFSKANFLHSEHYEVNTPFPSDGFIKGCYVLGSGYPESRVNRLASKVGWGCRQSWEEDVHACVSITKVTLYPAVVSGEYQCSRRGAYLCPIYMSNQKMASVADSDADYVSSISCV